MIEIEINDLDILIENIERANPRARQHSIGLPFVSASTNDLAWAGRIKDAKAVAAPIHELIVPTRHVPRLDDLTEDEERALWELADQRIEQVLSESGINAATILINDGEPAGQTVGHVHFHVLGINKQSLIDDLGAQFESLTDRYSEVAVAPISKHQIVTNDTDYLCQKMREFREEQNQIHDYNLGFSVLSQTQKQDSSDPYNMTIQSWNPNQARPFGLTNLIRVLNEYRDRPYSWSKTHLQQHFTPT